MTNKRTTKQQLVASIVLLFMCFSMLLGTTFAWFTDSATSAGNKIVAGTLDVELWMYDEAQAKYINIGDDATPIFGKAESLKAQNNNADTLWEPGKTQVVYLKLVNAGSLDLKYTVAINVRDNADDKDLYKALEYAIAPNAKQSDTELPAWNGGTKVNVGNNVATASTVTMTAGAEHYFALSVHMLEEAGNEYQGGYVEFDIKVAATQVASEEDSFGPNYDVNATLPEVDTIVLPTASTAPVDIVDYDEVADQVDTKITLPAGSAAGTYKLAVSNENVVTDAEGNTVASFDIELTRNGEKVPAGTYVVERYVGEYLNDVKVTHKGEPVAIDDYDPATGYVTFTVDSFSPFAVSYYRGVINNVDDLANIAKGGNFMLGADIEVAEAVVVPEGKSVVFDLNGKNITSAMTSGRTIVVNGVLNLKNGSIVTNDGVCGVYATGKSASLTLTDMTIDVNGTGSNAEWNHAAIGAANGATVVINNGTYSAEVGYGLIVMTSGAHITINDGTFTTEGATNSAAVRLDSGWDNSKIYTSAVINGGTFNAPEGGYAFTATNAYGKDIVIYDGIFNGKLASHYQEKGVVINGGTFNKTIVEGGGHTDKYLINGGTFVENVTKYLATGYTAISNNDGTYIVIPGENAELVSNGFYFDGADTYYINSAEGLFAFAASVNAYYNYERPYEGKTVVLMNNIDLQNAEWTPIGDYRFSANRFCGTFDGQGYTVSNFKITKNTDKSDSKKSSYGFFGNMEGTVKNLTIDNANVRAYAYVGALVGRMTNGTVENCHVINSTVETTYWQAGGMIGQLNEKCAVKNSTVVKSTVIGASAIGGMFGPLTATNEENVVKELLFENCLVKDCAIVQKGSFGASYDILFGAMFCDIDVADNKTDINNCKVENTTVKDVVSDALFGSLSGTKVLFDGYEFVSDGLYKNGVNYRVYNANGLATLNGMMANKTAGRDVVVNLMADIDFTGKTWTPVDSHADSAFEIAEINGNGYTIYNLTINGQAMFRRFAGTGDVVIKNITFDGATVNSNGSINTSILTVQTYQNTLLDNVDVKNSTITGGYKLAPLIATVYNENASTITATLKNCDVSDTVVTATSYDFCTTGMVAFVNAGNEDKIEFENCTVTNVSIFAPKVYTAHAWVYTTGSETLFNEVEGVTVSGCTFENK